MGGSCGRLRSLEGCLEKMLYALHQHHHKHTDTHTHTKEAGTLIDIYRLHKTTLSLVHIHTDTHNSLTLQGIHVMAHTTLKHQKPQERETTTHFP